MAASDPTAPPESVPGDAVDELYGLPVEEFTPRRDALAKELRAGGKRDAAAWVKALRKPSAAAWIVNQLARTRPKERKALLAAGQTLRVAHERAVAGEAGADELRAAADAEHEAARALAAGASGFLDRDGHPPSAATLERVAETIRAVALDDEARAEFEQGRLTRERAPSGFGPLGGGAPPPRVKPRPKSGARRAARKPPKGKAAGGAKPRAEAAVRKALEKAKTDQRAHAREVKAAERELGVAQREAERAQKRLERAAAGLEEARAREAEAKARIDELKRA